MKKPFHSPQKNRLLLSKKFTAWAFAPRQMLLALCAVLICPSAAVAASITWQTAATVSGDADVVTNGAPLYAYAWSGLNATVNTVRFAGTTSSGTVATDVSLSDSGGGLGQYSGYGSSSPPCGALSSGYQAVVGGGVYAYNNNDAVTVTLNNLTVGRLYSIQVWVNDSRGSSRTETITSSGGNTVTLAYNVATTGGGVGQYTLGTFTADGTSQTFTLFGAASTQINALQVRDVNATYVPPPPSAPMTMGVVTVSGDSDVLTNGTGLYAYGWGNGNATVNTVNFSGQGAGNADVGISASGASGGYAGAYFATTANPFASLSASYQTLLKGAYLAADANSTLTITLNNLTAGRTYAVQLWASDSRSNSRIETLDDLNGHTVPLVYNSTQADGGVGQYAIATFTAAGTSQVFTLLNASSSQLNALQVRDVTGTGYTPPGPPLPPAITWGRGTIRGDSDVLTVGNSAYAYCWATVGTSVNGVSFTQVNDNGPNLNITASIGGSYSGPYFANANNPYASLSASYQSILKGGYTANAGNTLFTVNLGGLTVGETYAVQLWVNDSRGANRTELISSANGNSTTLSYDLVQNAGGVGQYAIGVFTASTTNQSFTMLGAASTQINALQVRDVTGTGYVPPGLPLTAYNAMWNGGSLADSNWNDQTNWNGTLVTNGASLASVVFSGGLRQINTNNVSNLALGDLTFSNSGWNITGNSTVLWGNLVDNGNGLNTWGLNTTLNSMSSVMQSGANGVLNLTGVLSGSGGILQQGSSATSVLQLSNPNNSFTGGVYAQNGILAYGSIASSGQNSSLGAGSSDINVGSGYNTASLNYIGTSATTSGRGLTLTSGGGGSVSLNNNSPNNSGQTFNGNLTFVDNIGDTFTTYLWGTSTGTTIFNGQLTAPSSSTFNGAMQVAGPGTWAFNGLFYLTGNLSLVNNAKFVLGYYATAPNVLLCQEITVNSGSVLDVSSYDQNGQTFVPANYSGYPQTLVAGRPDGTSNTDINGSLSLTGQASATVNVAGSGVAGTMTINGNLVAGNGTFDFDLNTNSTAGSGMNDLIQVNGNLNLSGGPAVIQIRPLQGSLLLNTPYTLFSYTGSLSGSAAGLSVPAFGRYNAGVISTATPGKVTVTFTSATALANHLLWRGNNSANWDVTTRPIG